MIVDAEALDVCTPSAAIFDTNSPEPERRPTGAASPVPQLAMPPTAPRVAEPAMLGAGSAPPLSIVTGGPGAGESTISTPRDHQFTKLKWPEPRRMDSSPSLMSQQLSEWSSRAPPRRAEAQAPTHRRCRSEGVGFQSLQLTILLPPTPSSSSSSGPSRSADNTVAMSVPAFYSVQQTIVAALHECRRRLPSAAWRDLEGADLVLRITEDGEPQFDLPALAAKALVVDVGETELALCTKADHGPWHAELSDGEVEELRSMIDQNRAEGSSAMGGGRQPSPVEAGVEVAGAREGFGCVLS